MAWLAYNRERVDDLWRHARAAIDDLATITSDDPAAAEAMRTVRLAQEHLEGEWMPQLERIRASTALTAPVDLDPDGTRSWFDDAADSLVHPSPAGRTVIAPIVDGFTAEERQFFEGFATEVAASVASQLWLQRRPPRLPSRRSCPTSCANSDDRGEWGMARPALSDRAVPPHDRQRCGRAAARRGALLDRPARPHRDQLGRDAERSSWLPSRQPAASAARVAAASPAAGAYTATSTAARGEDGRCADIDHRLHQTRIGASHEQERSGRFPGGGARGGSQPLVGGVPVRQRHMAVRREGCDDRARTREAWWSPCGQTPGAGWRGPR